MSPHFGEEKTKNGKTYVYKQDSRGGNHGSWFLKNDTGAFNNTRATRGSATTDFTAQPENITDDEARNLLVDHAEDLSDIFIATVSNNPERFNPFQYAQKSIDRMGDSGWSDNNHRDLQVVDSMVEIMNRADISNDEKVNIIGNLRHELSDEAVIPRRSTWSNETTYTPGECLKNISDFIYEYVKQSPHRRTPRELEQYHNQPPVLDNPGLILKEDYLGQTTAEHDPVNASVINAPYYNAAVRATIAGEGTVATPSKYGYFDEKDGYFLDDYEATKMSLMDSEQEKLLSVFPNRELKQAMSTYGVNNVEVRSFANGREYGNVYTVMQPDGNTMSFSVYEHRNSDDIIINGTDNWDPDTGELPYAGGKYDYFAEIPHREYNQAADYLCFFMKEAQKGELADVNTLVKNAPTVDRTTTLAEKSPEFKQFLESYAPQEHARVERELSRRKTDDEVLRDLDF